LAQRSRKRGRRGHPKVVRPRPSAPAAPPPQPAASVRESLSGSRNDRAGSARPARGRSEERNATVRATLTPLAPGERPWPLKIAAAIALLIGGGDLVAVIVNGKFSVGNAHAGAGGVILFSALMLVCAVGMWQLRYWAVLGFQAILAFVILFFSLLLLRANNLWAVVAGVVVVGGGGYLFYKLVRVLSRLQTPQPPGP
jgi:hypothetical protein